MKVVVMNHVTLDGVVAAVAALNLVASEIATTGVLIATYRPGDHADS